MVDRILFESDDDDYDHNRNKLKLFFHTLSDYTVFTVTKDTKIGDFKKIYFEELTGRKPSGCCGQINFVFRGKKLDPRKTFGDYDIVDEERIDVVIRMTGC